MNPSDDRRKAGVFLLLAAGILVVVLGILAGARFLARNKTYRAEFLESVSGLDVSSPVKYNGVPVGAVTAIGFHPTDLTRILVDFEVRPEVPIKVNTRAQLKPQGITGIFYLELFGGTTDAPELDPDTPIPTDASLTAKIGGIAEDLSELVARLNRFVERNEVNMEKTLEDVAASAGSVRGALAKVEALAEKGGNFMDAVSAAVAEARALLADARAEVRATGEAARKAMAEVEAFATDPALREAPGKANRVLDLLAERLGAVDLRATVARVDAALEEFRRIEEGLARASDALRQAAETGRNDLAAVLSNVRAASEYVKAATREVREDPARLLRPRPSVDKRIPDPLPPLPEERR